MDKKVITIIILSIVILAICVFGFQFAGPNYRALVQRYNNSLGRIETLETAETGLQETNNRLVNELRLERIVSIGFKESSEKFESISIRLERNNRRQRNIIEQITSGDTGIDNTITRIENRLKGSYDYLQGLKPVPK